MNDSDTEKQQTGSKKTYIGGFLCLLYLMTWETERVPLSVSPANVWFDPDKNRFGVGTEQVGEKDKP